MTPLIPILAEIDGNNLLTIGSGAIVAIGGVAAAVIKAYRHGITRGAEQRNVHLQGQPIGVRLHDAFVTRTEFMEFRSEIKADSKEMRGLFDKAVTLITERDEKLTTKMNEIASVAFEGRRRIHDKVNTQGERLAAIETKADISKGLGTLGKAIMSRPCNQNRNPIES